MLRLLKIEWLKLANYRPFWVLSSLYAFLIIGIPTGVIEFLKWIKRLGEKFDGAIDPMTIPVLHFPDIWQNITWVYTFLKIFVAIILIISISNEFSYKTVRQNIIDGMDRLDFVKSKMAMILMLCLGSTILVFLTGLVTGLVYSGEIREGQMFNGVEFVFAYFLDLLAYLTFAFLMTVLLKRSALTVFLLLAYRFVEYIIILKLPDGLSGIADYFPLHSSTTLIETPFPRYLLQEIQDYVAFGPVLVVTAYVALFVLAIYTYLKKSDL